MAPDRVSGAVPVGPFTRVLRRWLPIFVAGAALAVLAGMGVARSPTSFRVGLGLAYGLWLAGIALVDLRTGRAPNRLVYPAIVLGLLGSVLVGLDAARDALLGGLVAFALLLLVAMLGRGAMGMGDVKFGLFCGIAVGLPGVLPMLAATFIIGLAVAAPLLALRLRRGDDAIAFTPFLALGTAAVLCFGPGYIWD